MHSKVVSRYILMYYNRQKRFFIHSSLLSLCWSPSLMSYTRWESRIQEKTRENSLVFPVFSSSSSSLSSFITVNRNERKKKPREKKSKISCLSLSLSLPLYRWLLPPSTPPSSSFLFKDCRRLGAASSDNAHTFYVIVVELCWPWMTRSSKTFLSNKTVFHSTID
jgi:hypothetical protein